MKTEYNVDYFIGKFGAIPEDQWTINTQQDKDNRRCAFGHCMSPENKKLKGYLFTEGGHETPEGKALMRLFIDTINKSPAIVNNGGCFFYRQFTPRERILAALYDIKERQQSQVKKRIVYVTVDQEVRELQEAELSSQ